MSVSNFAASNKKHWHG